MRFVRIQRVSAVAKHVSSMGSKSSAKNEMELAEGKKQSMFAALQNFMRWIPTSRKDIIASEQRLLTLIKTPYQQEQINIGSGPPGSKLRWFRSTSSEPRFINTITFEKNSGAAAEAEVVEEEEVPTIVLVHGYGASQGFFFRNFDALATKFRVLAIDQLGWGASSRPDFTCKSTEETESWFIDSLEEWRKAKNLDNFILLGHSLGGYIAARYALKHPEHVKHLILVGPAGFSAESDRWIELKSTWKGVLANFIWESNVTPQAIIRGLGPFGPNLVRRYAGARFGTNASGTMLNEQESKLFSDYMFHTLAARASGELCLKYIFSLGAFARSPLLTSAPDWKVPTSFIYGVEDWMDFRGAEEARKRMNVPCEIIRVPQGGHFVMLDNAPGFDAAVTYACRNYLPGRSGFNLTGGISLV